MKIENTTAQMRKGVLEFCILSLISGGDLYTSEILEALKRKDVGGRRNCLSITYPTKECQFIKLPLGGIYLWTSEEILFHHQRGGGISWRAPNRLERIK